MPTGSMIYYLTQSQIPYLLCTLKIARTFYKQVKYIRSTFLSKDLRNARFTNYYFLQFLIYKYPKVQHINNQPTESSTANKRVEWLSSKGNAMMCSPEIPLNVDNFSKLWHIFIYKKHTICLESKTAVFFFIILLKICSFLNCSITAEDFFLSSVMVACGPEVISKFHARQSRQKVLGAVHKIHNTFYC